VLSLGIDNLDFCLPSPHACDGLAKAGILPRAAFHTDGRPSEARIRSHRHVSAEWRFQRDRVTRLDRAKRFTE